MDLGGQDSTRGARHLDLRIAESDQIQERLRREPGADPRRRAEDSCATRRPVQAMVR
jgi:hypothetical protein